MPNSHRQARPDKTVQNSPVSVVAASAMWIEFSTTQDCRRQEIRSLNTLIAIVQFTPARHWQDCFVVSGVAVWIESARPPDRCVLCRVCVGVRRAVAAVAIAAAATQASQAARPSRQTAHTQRRVRHAKCKHAVDCCIWLNLNFFTKRHATRVIYRLTVQTLPDSLETRFTPPDTTQTGPSCRIWRAVWIGHETHTAAVVHRQQ